MDLGVRVARPRRFAAAALVGVTMLGGAAAPTARPEEQRLVVGAPVVLTASSGGRVATVRIAVAPIRKQGLFWKLLAPDAWYTPATEVETFSIKVGGQDIGVPPGAVLDIFDLHRATLKASGAGFVLDLTAGDGAVGYDVHIRFDQKRVFERTVTDGESGGLMERSSYLALAPLKDVPAPKPK